MKQITLTRGLAALVDDADYDELAKHKWYASKAGYAIRAMTDPERPGKQRTVYMHREILGLHFGDERQGDHRDRNKLNNQRSNLRIASAGENMRNRKMQSRSASGSKGVYFCNGRWRANIRVAGELKYLGSFKVIGDAADAYRVAAIKYHGEFASLR